MSDPAVYYEAAQTAVAATALTDSGDAKTFKSAVNFWSGRSGYTPTILPNGLIAGCVVTPGVEVDSVRVTAGTCNLNGVADKLIEAVVDDSLVIDRDETYGYQKSSVTITNAPDSSSAQVARPENRCASIVAPSTAELRAGSKVSGSEDRQTEMVDVASAPAIPVIETSMTSDSTMASSFFMCEFPL